MPVMDSDIQNPEQPRSPVLSPGRPKSRASPRDSPSQIIYNPFFTGRPRTPTGGPRNETVDRQEIIRKIKEKSVGRQKSYEANNQHQVSSTDVQTLHTTPRADVVGEPVLLPSPEIDFKSDFPNDQTIDAATRGLEISRPRSALHRGDFRGAEQQGPGQSVADSPRPSPGLPSSEFAATSPPAPWHDGFPNTSIYRSRRYLSTPIAAADHFRPRALSGASLSHSFSYQAPTSPLVNQSNVEDSPEDFMHARRPLLPDHSGRRQTLSPASSFTGFGDSNPWHSPPASLRRESTFLYQAHQPRRSITSLHSLPQSPAMGGRRSSGIGSSPHQSSMVGSFEESILKGRMSSTPSRPLNFTAHIGVLGIGDCKPSLKCPAHIIIPFPAVFYSYGQSNNNNHDSQPSPYVGLVDLENAPSNRDFKHRRKQRVRPGTDHDIQHTPGTTTSTEDSDSRRRLKQKNKRRSHSPLDEPKGGYRLPPRGQLQIIIKNPNKTAVKLFLVPYDVSDMQPGQKTFIRQRSYSAGPILDLGSAQPQPSHTTQDRTILRYLIHLHICCTSQGRFWLYNTVRVVFANRVPDGKEKLRNETQLPEPKYSLYRPRQTSAASTPLMASQLDGTLPMDLDSPPSARDRPSMSYAVRPHRPEARSLPGRSLYEGLYSRQTQPAFQLPVLETVASRPTSRGLAEEQAAPDDGEGQQFRPWSPGTESSEGTAGSFTFSRSSSSEKLHGVRAESLLSRRLRDLEMSRKGRGQGEDRKDE